MIIFTGLQYNSSFFSDYNKLMKRRQKYVDSEVLRLSDPYVPFRSGMLKKSGISGTVVGSGVVEYIAPYAENQYKNNAGMGVEGMKKGGGIRGKQWIFSATRRLNTPSRRFRATRFFRSISTVVE